MRHISRVLVEHNELEDLEPRVHAPIITPITCEYDVLGLPGAFP